MLYATNTGVAPVATAVATAFVTAVKMSPLHPPNHLATAFCAILSICVASAGRVVRHESAVFWALEYGSTQNQAPRIGLEPTGTGAGAGAGSGAGAGAGAGCFLCLSPSGPVAASLHAASATMAAANRA